MYEILIDEHRHIYGAVWVSDAATDAVKGVRRARLNHYREQCVAAGHTPSVHSQATLPAGFAVGRVLSADGRSAAHPTDSHPPVLVESRRSKVVAWAVDNTGHEYLLRAVRDINVGRNTGVPDDARHQGRAPYPSAIYLAFIQSTLAASFADANLRNATVWETMERNMKYKASDMPSIGVSSWKDRYDRMDAMTVFVKAGSTFTVGPVEIRLPQPVDADAIRWALATLHNRR